MKILVIGAAGRTGSAVVEQAVAAGHEVTAFRGHVVVAVGAPRSRLAEPWTFSSLAEEVHLPHLGVSCHRDHAYV